MDTFEKKHTQANKINTPQKNPHIYYISIVCFVDLKCNMTHTVRCLACLFYVVAGIR